ncbi:MAG: serine/threonine protein kinase, partial [Planctomycetes bacterium]|nr:serine/threonine protein kinase [Planctomycetota bacterium]
HRDIKPANIYLTKCGRIHDFVKVLDFGLAKSLDENAPKISAVDAIVGTPEYMCPEMIKQETEIDGRSDLYSLGIVGYFLLTGNTPFDGEKLMTIFHNQMHSKPALMQENDASIPDDLQEVIMRCLEKEPQARPASAQILRQQLEACAEDNAWDETQARHWWQNTWSTPAVESDDFTGDLSCSTTMIIEEKEDLH